MPEPFHDAMEAVLAGHAAALDPWIAGDARSRAGLAVHRNTVATGRARALAGLFPTVERLVGADWFRHAALTFAAETPPGDPVLDDYGADFPVWLSVFPPARDLPYLAPVARLDQAWSRAHRSVDAPALTAEAVAGADGSALFAARAILHPSARLFWFDWSVASIWLANRPDAPPDLEVEWRDTPEGLLIVRPGMTVIARRLSRAEWLFLDACRAGRTLGQAATTALSPADVGRLPHLFAALLGAGALTRLDPEPARP